MDGNYSYLVQEYSSEILKALLPLDILYSVVIIAGIIGNITVIFTYATKMRKGKLESRYFIPVLAFYDLIVCIVSEIYFLTNSHFLAKFDSDELCKTLLFFLVQTMMTSDSFLLAIGIQRYVKICRPHGKQMTLFWRRVTVVLVIATNVFYSIPTAIVSGIQEMPVVYKNVNISGKSCSTGNNQYRKFQLIYFGILMIILVTNIVVTAGMYAPIACVIFRRIRQRRVQQNTGIHLTSAEESETTHSKASASTAKEEETRNKIKRNNLSKTNFNVMFFVIIFAYIVSFVPTAVMLALVTLDDTIWSRSSYEEIRSYTFLIRSYVFNHAANPFIYAYFDSEFRSRTTDLFGRTCT